MVTIVRFLVFLLSLVQDVRGSMEYVPSFYNDGNFDNDDIYNAKFRFVPCSVCFRNEVITQPDVVLPINTAGVLNEAATCAATDAVAASGTYSPAACVLLRSRVRRTCGCQIPPPPCTCSIVVSHQLPSVLTHASNACVGLSFIYSSRCLTIFPQQYPFPLQST